MGRGKPHSSGITSTQPLNSITDIIGAPVTVIANNRWSLSAPVQANRSLDEIAWLLLLDLDRSGGTISAQMGVGAPTGRTIYGIEGTLRRGGQVRAAESDVLEDGLTANHTILGTAQVIEGASLVIDIDLTQFPQFGSTTRGISWHLFAWVPTDLSPTGRLFGYEGADLP